ncbi:putative secreted hydrolase [Roseimicrobium gellanilyticum]|uniref:Putative secreted hydrolase n=1 Tax=Roseimicrobium gellanilyticum TaxID=748857 RepID=A0A366HNS2_9BACT|nr:lipocalin-like domain-containing protein [Roseimicrobium gellanilyticum]RBP45137.1 putative secreted hydrolase [Roseimicrobium gellanilyticum]
MNMKQQRLTRLIHSVITMLCVVASPVAHAQLTTEDGFALPQPGRQFTFPRDHGSHPEFRTEWWYITGHLDAKDGRRFGFQVTFFRQANRQPDGTVRQLHFAHAALLDAKTGKFIHQERLNREGWDASSSSTGLDVRNGNWTLKQETNTQRLQLNATVHADALLTLTLDPAKPLVIFGENGVSRKGVAQNAASHYLTFPRLKVSGSVKQGAETLEVAGDAWMDHEFSSSQLDDGQVGWDWAALQFHDGTEMMVYRMRRADGSTDAASKLVLIGKDSTQRALKADAFSWKEITTWQSPRSGAKYPIEVEVAIEQTAYRLRPLARDQEQGGDITGLPYWEGACDILDAQGKIVGRAFLELAGYAGNLRKHLSGKQ